MLVWRKAHELVIEIYTITKVFPSEERFGLILQMRRAAVSIPANIAEGFVKKGIRNKSNFYNIAQGSLEELKYYLILSEDLKFAKVDHIAEKAKEVGRLLYKLIFSLETTGSK